MYAQMVETGVKAVRTAADMTAEGARVPGAHRCRRQGRAEGLDARRLPQDADPADLAARAFRDRRHAARRQLDHPRADAEAQGDPDGQGPGRGRARPLPLLRRRDARRVARPDDRRPAFRQGQVLQHLQLPDADVGRHRRDRLARRRRGDHEPDSAVPLLVRPVCPRDGPHLQGRELPPAPGLRHHAGAVPRHAGAESDGAGRAQPLVVAVADDVRAVGCRKRAQRAIGGVEDQAPVERRAAPALSSTRRCRRPTTSASRCPIPISSGTPTAATTISARSTGANSTRVVKGNGPCNRDRLAHPREGVGGWRLGARGGDRARRQACGRREAATRRRRDARWTGRRRSRSDDERMAAVGDLHSQPARPRAQARGQPARAGRGDGDQERARRLHAAQRGRVDLGREVGGHRRRPPRATRRRCSSRPTARSTGTRRSFRCPTK